jgi:hypothetical protein
MHDPLILVAQPEIREAEFLDVFLQGDALEARVFFFDELGNGFDVLAGGRGDVVVGGGEGAVGAADLSGGVFEAFEGLGGGHFVDEVAVDIEELESVMSVVVAYI